MNDGMITQEHGYPIRVIMPETVNSMSVKWLRTIILSDNKSRIFFRYKDYQSYNSSTHWKIIDFKRKFPMQCIPIQTVIDEPSNGNTVSTDEGDVVVNWFAWSCGGSGITRVSISLDGGQSWIPAKLKKLNENNNDEWVSVMWEVQVSRQHTH